MSAYIVDETVMHRVLSGVVTALHGEGFTDRQSMTDLGRKLFTMNVAAVRQRYPGHDDHIAGLELAAAFTLTSRPDEARTVAQMASCYKAITCLLYQCSEGDVPDSDQFKGLEALQSRLAHFIVAALPEYERAAW